MQDCARSYSPTAGSSLCAPQPSVVLRTDPTPVFAVPSSENRDPCESTQSHDGHTRILYGRKGGQKEPHKACLALQETCSDPFNAFSPIHGVPCLVQLFLTAFSPVENTGLPAVEYFRGLPPPGAHLASYLPETHNHVVQSACPPNGQEARHSDILYLFGAWNRPGLTCPRGTVEFHLSGASHVTRWSS